MGQITSCDESERGWYIPPLSIVVTIVGGALLILLAKGIKIFKKNLKKRNRSKIPHQEIALQADQEELQEENKGCLMKVQDWAAFFISGQSKFGGILVRHYLKFCNFQNDKNIVARNYS